MALYPLTPKDWAKFECSRGTILPLLGIFHYRRSQLVRGDLPHWGIFYSEWVLNVLGHFDADVHHRGILWRSPEKVVDIINRLGL
jgi:hypothetical protein